MSETGIWRGRIVAGDLEMAAVVRFVKAGPHQLSAWQGQGSSDQLWSVGCEYETDVGTVIVRRSRRGPSEGYEFVGSGESRGDLAAAMGIAECDRWS